MGDKEHSLQLRDVPTFLQDCTQILQVTGLKITVCQSMGKKEINQPGLQDFKRACKLHSYEN